MPMVFALVSTRVDGLEVTRKNIQLSFRKHAYTTASFWGLLLIGIVIAGVSSGFLDETGVGSVAIFALCVCMAWFCLAQSRVLADELKSSRAKGLGLTFVAGLTWCTIIGIVIAIAAETGGPAAEEAIPAADVTCEPPTAS